MKCNHCGCEEFFEQQKGDHIGVYCKSCNKWIKWRSKSEASYQNTKSEMNTIYNHVEAFCIMTYKCDYCHFEEKIWNSRDGVTPFIIGCTRCRGEMQHINWEQDERNENYIPSEGSRVFIDFPDSLRKPFALKRIKLYENTHTVKPEEYNNLLERLMKSDYDHEPFLIII